MFRNRWMYLFPIVLLIFLLFCIDLKKPKMSFSGQKGEVKIITLDPGHFHAALVQKTMYDQVDPQVFVYGPRGPDLQDHLGRVQGFNTRDHEPTHWVEIVYTEDDFLQKMIKDRSGNVVVISGNNKVKTAYITFAVKAGLNVLADKPMCINKEGFESLKETFYRAQENQVLLYDIMTERYEITTILQKILAGIPELFGTLQKGTPDEPAVIKESVHHFFKTVSGNPIKRPAWYFDTDQQGEGLVDVTTHLVDLVQWGCFPEQRIDYEKDVEMIRARRWTTQISPQQFQKVTRLSEFPKFLKMKINAESDLPVYANGEMIYRLRGIHVKVSVIWNFQAPEGGGDTHFSLMRGTKSNIVIQQGKEQHYRPELFIDIVDQENRQAIDSALEEAMEDLQRSYPGVEKKNEGHRIRVIIPDRYRIGHEAHFGQVTQKYLSYLIDGKLPQWEVPNMIAKYYTTTTALEMAKERQ